MLDKETPHQLHPGPPKHRTFQDVYVYYVNVLEERCNATERELMAAREREHRYQNQGTPVSDEPKSALPTYDNLVRLLSDVRNKNTELEAINRELRQLSQDQHSMIEGATDACNNAQRRLSAAYEEIRRLKEHNSTLINECRSRGVNEFSEACGQWTRETFDEMVWRSPVERGARLVEEAVECAQVAGVPKNMVARIVHRVYAKPVGEMKQELGGVIICWGSMVSALNLDAKVIISDALADCWNRQKTIREKWLVKVQEGVSVKFDAPMDTSALRGPDGEDIPNRMPYAAAPRSYDEQSLDIIEEGRKALDTHNAATRDPH